jgi:hypothetical protein
MRTPNSTAADLRLHQRRLAGAIGCRGGLRECPIGRHCGPQLGQLAHDRINPVKDGCGLEHGRSPLIVEREEPLDTAGL